MATTWIKAIHRGSGIAAALGRTTDYIKDPSKTENGELVDSYECHPYTAQSEFLLSKRQYAKQTGRDQGKRDVIAYHIRMSFKPGEVTAEKALELGNELAMRWTKGKHQYILAAHTNTNNPHVHIIYNSVNLDHDGKWQDFKRSAIALRRVSDQICLENGLSVIENPGLSKGQNRAEYLGENKPPTVREQLRGLMDYVLPACRDFEGFLAALQDFGVEIKRGKQLSFKLPDGKRFTRHDTLGDDYSMDALLEKISAERVLPEMEGTDLQAETQGNDSWTETQDTDSRADTINDSQSKTKVSSQLNTQNNTQLNPQNKTKPNPQNKTERPNLLIDIQAKLQQGYGAGFEHWATVSNIKQMAKTLLFLQERGLDSHELLKAKTAEVTTAFNEKANRIKAIEKGQKEIAELQKQIGTYSKTRDIYAEYRRLKKTQQSTWARLTKAEHPADKFYAENRADIALHESAKKHFDRLGFGKDNKLPSVKTLQTEYAKLQTEKRKLYATYKQERAEMIELRMALQNVDVMLGGRGQAEKNRGLGVEQNHSRGASQNHSRGAGQNHSRGVAQKKQKRERGMSL